MTILRHYAKAVLTRYSEFALHNKHKWGTIFARELPIDNEIPRGSRLMDISLDSLKVMVVDDSKTIRRTAETLLQKEGCEVVTAEDGFEALAKIADHRPDIIFVDIMMPRLDGYQTCALIKNNSEFRHTPVVMLSSKDGLFDKAKGRIVGSDHYLTKPFSKSELLGAIQVNVAAMQARLAANGASK